MSGKTEIRHRLLDRRKEQPDKDEVSQQIYERLKTVVEYNELSRRLIYVSVRGEVRTIPLIKQLLDRHDATTFIPYCREDKLAVFEIRSLDDLARGKYGILEPRDALRSWNDRHRTIADMEVAVIPGVAFDQRCQRLGYGKGFFDRLLGDAPDSLVKIGLAFDCQIVEQLPAASHDVAMDYVVTERRVIRRQAEPED